MAINGRKKGAKQERIACGVLQKWTRKPFTRASVMAGGRLQFKSQNKGDIICNKEGHYFPFSIEIKSYAKIDFAHLLVDGVQSDILKWWEQCKKDALYAKKVPMLLMRYNSLPKEFYFLVLPTLFINRLSPLLALGTRPIKLQFADWPNENFFTVLSSREFFKNPYKPIKEIAKTYIRESKG